jgi:hypothetical protein
MLAKGPDQGVALKGGKIEHEVIVR